MSSFGYSGTIVHTVLESTPPLTTAMDVRDCGAWPQVLPGSGTAGVKTPHPLIQRRATVDADGDERRTPSVSPASGRARSPSWRTTSCGGHIVFPGAGYLEMACAARRLSVAGSAKAAAVRSRVFFLQPLMLDGDLSTMTLSVDNLGG